MIAKPKPAVGLTRKQVEELVEKRVAARAAEIAAQAAQRAEDQRIADEMDRAMGLSVQGYRAPYRREDGAFVHPINRPSDVRAAGGGQ